MNIGNIIYDSKTKRYRYKRGNKPGEPITGSFISRGDVVQMHQDYLAIARQQFIDLAPKIKQGKAGAFTEVSELLRSIHVTNAIIEARGIDNLTTSDLGKIGSILKKQYHQGKGKDGKSYGLKFLFQDIVDNPNYSTALLTNRLKMFSNSGEISASAIKERIAKDKGYTSMRRILGVTDIHCDDCIKYFRSGWVGIGELPLPKTECQCFTNCKCRVEYR
jgi:hypothetical protein